MEEGVYGVCLLCPLYPLLILAYYLFNGLNSCNLHHHNPRSIGNLLFQSLGNTCPNVKLKQLYV